MKWFVLITPEPFYGVGQMVSGFLTNNRRRGAEVLGANSSRTEILRKEITVHPP
jgi:hypothetical protein